MRPREDGAIGVVAALIVPVLIVFLLHLFRFAVVTKTSLDVGRVAAAGVEAELAAYSRDLYDWFGIFAAAMDGETAQKATLNMLSEPFAITAHGQRALSEPAALKAEIVRHMKLRAPLTILSDVMGRHQAIWPSVSAEAPLEKQMQQLSSAIDVKDPVSAVDGSFLGIDASFISDIVEDELRKLYEEIVTDLMPAEIYEPGANGTIDLFDPQTLSELGAFIDGLFAFRDYGMFEHLYLAEYVASYFQHATPILYLQTTRYELRTPDGRPLSTFPAQRRLEVEQIIMDGSADEASRKVQNTIRAIRTIIHLADKFNDPVKRADYLTKAVTASGVIAALTLGAVVIPPENMVYLYMLYDAHHDGKRDVSRLTQGFGVRLWPGAGLELYYPDYLRMLLLVQPTERLVERIYRQISKVVAGPHYTQVSVTVVAANDQATLEGQYRGETNER